MWGRRCAWLAVLLSMEALAGAEQGREVTASTLNVRSGPGTSYSIVGVAGTGQRYVSFASSGGWYRIWWAGGSGWVYGAYTALVTGTGARVNVSSLNIRTGPSTSYSTVGSAGSGQIYYLIATSGSWKRIWFGGAARWCYGPYTTNESLGGTPPPPSPRWSSTYVGIDKDGSRIPRAGVANQTLYNTLGIRTEPYGSVVSYSSRSFVRGKVSSFGGPGDNNGTMAITGISSEWHNNPTRPSPEYAAANPAKYYYCAMRWDYTPNGRTWWRSQRLVVINPSNGRACVVAPVDWGPHTRTGRTLDLSPYVMTQLGLATDDNAVVAFEQAGTPLGPR